MFAAAQPIAHGEPLGELTAKWERFEYSNGKVVYLDHFTHTATPVDPCTFHFRKRTVKDIIEGELPYGWEEVTLDGTTFYVDHISQTTHASLRFCSPTIICGRRELLPGYAICNQWM